MCSYCHHGEKATVQLRKITEQESKNNSLSEEIQEKIEKVMFFLLFFLLKKKSFILLILFVCVAVQDRRPIQNTSIFRFGTKEGFLAEKKYDW
jgi:hypothetical protein